MVLCFRVIEGRTELEEDSTTLSTPAELVPLNRIRVETALSRFPVHRLAKKGNVAIDLNRSTDGVHTDFRWKVSYNNEFGQPGPLAYKVDTLIVNRRIDEASRPLQEVIKLGTLREICRDLGLADHDTESVKRAFYQNASTFITAKIRYKTRTGRERWGEIGYTRYSVVFTGETLPDGKTADAVYIVINASYRDLLNHVEVRPLDYDYLMLLAPGPQRFYELLSFQVYGAIASGRPRAKMLYSDYCKYAPQTRYPDFDHMKKQMYKVHLPHRESGYIGKVDYQETTDPQGESDWEMFYTPGPKALAEYQAFTNRQIRQQTPTQALLQTTTASDVKHPVQAILDLSGVDSAVHTELTRRGVAEKKARELLANLKPGQEPMDQIEYVDWLIAKAKQGKFENPPGMYVLYVRDNIMLPENFVSSRKRRLHEEAQQAQNTERAQQAQLEIAYEDYRYAAVEGYITSLAPAEYQQLMAAARREQKLKYPNMTAEQLNGVAANWMRGDLKNTGRVPLLSFQEFCRDHAPQRYPPR
jgi:type II secretory pathway pseudopilin PulG